MRLSPAALLCLLVIVAIGAAPAPADEPTPSTAATTTTVEKSTPREPIRALLGSEATQVTVEGKTSATRPGVVLFAAPVDRMMRIRISSPEHQARLVVYRPGADKGDLGAAEEDGAIMWISQIDKPGDLRLEARTLSETELPFRIEIEVPPADGAAPAEAAPAQPATLPASGS